MNRPVFAPGIRLSSLDVVVLVLGAVAAGGLLMVAVWAAFVVAFVAGHFFLFCNVFRISRGLELAWSGLFILLAAATLITGSPGWAITSVSALAVTVVVVVLEMRKPSYHGVFWRWINPNLHEWWKSNTKSRTE